MADPVIIDKEDWPDPHGELTRAADWVCDSLGVWAMPDGVTDPNQLGESTRALIALRDCLRRNKRLVEMAKSASAQDDAGLTIPLA